MSDDEIDFAASFLEPEPVGLAAAAGEGQVVLAAADPVVEGAIVSTTCRISFSQRVQGSVTAFFGGVLNTSRVC